MKVLREHANITSAKAELTTTKEKRKLGNYSVNVLETIHAR